MARVIRKSLKAARAARRLGGGVGLGGTPGRAWLTAGRRAQVAGALQRAIQANLTNPFNPTLHPIDPATGHFRSTGGEKPRPWGIRAVGGMGRRAAVAGPLSRQRFARGGLPTGAGGRGGGGVPGAGAPGGKPGIVYPKYGTQTDIKNAAGKVVGTDPGAAGWFDPGPITDPATGQVRERMTTAAYGGVRAALSHPPIGATEAHKDGFLRAGPDGQSNLRRGLQGIADKHSGTHLKPDNPEHAVRLKRGRATGQIRTEQQQRDIEQLSTDSNFYHATAEAMTQRHVTPAGGAAISGRRVQESPKDDGFTYLDGKPYYFKPGIEPTAQNGSKIENWQEVHPDVLSAVHTLDARGEKETLPGAGIINWTMPVEKAFGVSPVQQEDGSWVLPEDPSSRIGRPIIVSDAARIGRFGVPLTSDQLPVSNGGKPVVHVSAWVAQGSGVIVPGGRHDQQAAETAILRAGSYGQVTDIYQLPNGDWQMGVVVHPIKQGLEPGRLLGHKLPAREQLGRRAVATTRKTPTGEVEVAVEPPLLTRPPVPGKAPGEQTGTAVRAPLKRKPVSKEIARALEVVRTQAMEGLRGGRKPMFQDMVDYKDGKRVVRQLKPAEREYLRKLITRTESDGKTPVTVSEEARRAVQTITGRTTMEPADADAIIRQTRTAMARYQEPPSASRLAKIKREIAAMPVPKTEAPAKRAPRVPRVIATGPGRAAKVVTTPVPKRSLVAPDNYVKDLQTGITGEIKAVGKNGRATVRWFGVSGPGGRAEKTVSHMDLSDEKRYKLGVTRIATKGGGYDVIHTSKQEAREAIKREREAAAQALADKRVERSTEIAKLQQKLKKTDKEQARLTELLNDELVDDTRPPTTSGPAPAPSATAPAVKVASDRVGPFENMRGPRTGDQVLGLASDEASSAAVRRQKAIDKIHDELEFDADERNADIVLRNTLSRMQGHVGTNPELRRAGAVTFADLDKQLEKDFPGLADSGLVHGVIAKLANHDPNLKLGHLSGRALTDDLDAAALEVDGRPYHYLQFKPDGLPTQAGELQKRWFGEPGDAGTWDRNIVAREGTVVSGEKGVRVRWNDTKKEEVIPWPDINDEKAVEAFVRKYRFLSTDEQKALAEVEAPAARQAAVWGPKNPRAVEFQAAKRGEAGAERAAKPVTPEEVGGKEYVEKVSGELTKEEQEKGISVIRGDRYGDRGFSDDVDVRKVQMVNAAKRAYTFVKGKSTEDAVSVDDLTAQLTRPDHEGRHRFSEKAVGALVQRMVKADQAVLSDDGDMITIRDAKKIERLPVERPTGTAAELERYNERKRIEGELRRGRQIEELKRGAEALKAREAAEHAKGVKKTEGAITERGLLHGAPAVAAASALKDPKRYLAMVREEPMRDWEKLLELTGRREPYEALITAIWPDAFKGITDPKKRREIPAARTKQQMVGSIMRHMAEPDLSFEDLNKEISDNKQAAAAVKTAGKVVRAPKPVEMPPWAQAAKLAPDEFTDYTDNLTAAQKSAYRAARSPSRGQDHVEAMKWARMTPAERAAAGKKITVPRQAAVKATPAKAAGKTVTAPAKKAAAPAKKAVKRAAQPAVEVVKEVEAGKELTGDGPEGLSDVPEVRATQIENKVRKAFQAAPPMSRAGGVWLADIREAVGPSVSRQELDDALVRLGRQRGISLLPNENQQEFDPSINKKGPERLAAAVQIGPIKYSYMDMEPDNLTPRPLPAVAKKAVRTVKAAAPAKKAVAPVKAAEKTVTVADPDTVAAQILKGDDSGLAGLRLPGLRQVATKIALPGRSKLGLEQLRGALSQRAAELKPAAPVKAGKKAAEAVVRRAVTPAAAAPVKAAGRAARPTIEQVSSGIPGFRDKFDPDLVMLGNDLASRKAMKDVVKDFDNRLALAKRAYTRDHTPGTPGSTIAEARARLSPQEVADLKAREVDDAARIARLTEVSKRLHEATGRPTKTVRKAAGPQMGATPAGEQPQAPRRAVMRATPRAASIGRPASPPTERAVKRAASVSRAEAKQTAEQVAEATAAPKIDITPNQEELLRAADKLTRQFLAREVADGKHLGGVSSSLRAMERKGLLRSVTNDKGERLFEVTDLGRKVNIPTPEAAPVKAAGKTIKRAGTKAAAPVRKVDAAGRPLKGAADGTYQDDAGKWWRVEGGIPREVSAREAAKATAAPAPVKAVKAVAKKAQAPVRHLDDEGRPLKGAADGTYQDHAGDWWLVKGGVPKKVTAAQAAKPSAAPAKKAVKAARTVTAPAPTPAAVPATRRSGRPTLTPLMAGLHFPGEHHDPDLIQLRDGLADTRRPLKSVIADFDHRLALARRRHAFDYGGLTDEQKKVSAEVAKSTARIERMAEVSKRLHEAVPGAKKVTAPTPVKAAAQAVVTRAGAFDPVEQYIDGGEDSLRERLAELDIPSLQKMVRASDMNTGGLPARWKTRDRLVDHIVARSAERSVKGNAFLQPKTHPGVRMRADEFEPGDRIMVRPAGLATTSVVPAPTSAKDAFPATVRSIVKSPDGAYHLAVETDDGRRLEAAGRLAGARTAERYMTEASFQGALKKEAKKVARAEARQGDQRLLDAVQGSRSEDFEHTGPLGGHGALALLDLHDKTSAPGTAAFRAIEPDTDSERQQLARLKELGLARHTRANGWLITAKGRQAVTRLGAAEAEPTPTAAPARAPIKAARRAVKAGPAPAALAPTPEPAAPAGKTVARRAAAVSPRIDELHTAVTSAATPQEARDLLVKADRRTLDALARKAGFSLWRPTTTDIKQQRIEAASFLAGGRLRSDIKMFHAPLVGRDRTPYASADDFLARAPDDVLRGLRGRIIDPKAVVTPPFGVTGDDIKQELLRRAGVRASKPLASVIDIPADDQMRRELEAIPTRATGTTYKVPDPDPSTRLTIDRRGAVGGSVAAKDIPKILVSPTSDDEPVHVRDLSLFGEQYIEHGLMWKDPDGTSYLIETDGTPEGALRARVPLTALRERQALLPERAQKVAKAHVLTSNVSAREAGLRAERLAAGLVHDDMHPAVHAEAFPGTGTTLWYRDMAFIQTRTPSFGNYMHFHEAGHHVHVGILGVTSEEHVPDYIYDVMATRPAPALRDWGFKPLTPDLHLREFWRGFRALYAGFTNDEADLFKRPGTEYGRKLKVEALAEEFAFYNMGQLGWVVKGNQQLPVWYRDYFPARAAMFDRAFPGVHREQLADIAASRRGPMPSIRRAVSRDELAEIMAAPPEVRVRAVAKAVPETLAAPSFEPKKITARDFRFTRNGLSTTVEKPYKRGDKIIYEGQVRTADGDIVGGFEYHVNPTTGVAHLQSMAMGHEDDSPFRRTGFTRAFTTTVERKLAAGGIHTVTLDAAYGGAPVWAKLGYNWLTPDMEGRKGAGDLPYNMLERLQRGDLSPEDESLVRGWLDRFRNNPGESSAWPSLQEIVSHPIGEKILQGEIIGPSFQAAKRIGIAPLPRGGEEIQPAKAAKKAIKRATRAAEAAPAPTPAPAPAKKAAKAAKAAAPVKLRPEMPTGEQRMANKLAAQIARERPAKKAAPRTGRLTEAEKEKIFAPPRMLRGEGAAPAAKTVQAAVPAGYAAALRHVISPKTGDVRSSRDLPPEIRSQLPRNGLAPLVAKGWLKKDADGIYRPTELGKSTDKAMQTARGAATRAAKKAQAPAAPAPAKKAVKAAEKAPEAPKPAVKRAVAKKAAAAAPAKKAAPTPAAPAPAPAAETAVDNKVREAYRALAENPRDWVMLSDLRRHPALKDVPRSEVDDALKRLEQRRDGFGADVTPESNQKTLKKRDRDAAVVIGNQAKHAISFEDASAPPVKPAVKRAVAKATKAAAPAAAPTARMSEWAKKAGLTDQQWADYESLKSVEMPDGVKDRRSSFRAKLARSLGQGQTLEQAHQDALALARGETTPARPTISRATPQAPGAPAAAAKPVVRRGIPAATTKSATTRGMEVGESASAQDVRDAVKLHDRPKARPEITPEPSPDFDETRALSYKPLPGRTTPATIMVEKAGHKTTITTSDGKTMDMEGTWVRVPEDPSKPKGAFYGVEYGRWLDTYRRVPGTDEWEKIAPVKAYRLGPDDQPMQVITRNKGKIEKIDTAEPGDWVVQQKHGELQKVTDDKFRGRYDMNPVVEALPKGRKVAVQRVKISGAMSRVKQLPQGVIKGNLDEDEVKALPHLIGDAVTGPEGIPVKEFTLPVAVEGVLKPRRIRNGTVWRHESGALVLVEHGTTPAEIAHARRLQREITAHHIDRFHGSPKAVSYTVVGHAGSIEANGKSWDQWADAGYQGVTFYNSGKLLDHIEEDGWRRGPYLTHTIDHENDHIEWIRGRRKELIDRDGNPTQAFREAVDELPQISKIDHLEAIPGDRASDELVAAVRMRTKGQTGGWHVPGGSTKYSGASYTEEAAEGAAFYQKGQVAIGHFKDGTVRPVYFSEIYPKRSALYARYYPDVARAQREEMAGVKTATRTPGDEFRRLTPAQDRDLDVIRHASLDETTDEHKWVSPTKIGVTPQTARDLALRGLVEERQDAMNGQMVRIPDATLKQSEEQTRRVQRLIDDLRAQAGPREHVRAIQEHVAEQRGVSRPGRIRLARTRRALDRIEEAARRKAIGSPITALLGNPKKDIPGSLSPEVRDLYWAWKKGEHLPQPEEDRLVDALTSQAQDWAYTRMFADEKVGDKILEKVRDRGKRRFDKFYDLQARKVLSEQPQGEFTPGNLERVEKRLGRATFDLKEARETGNKTRIAEAQQEFDDAKLEHDKVASIRSLFSESLQRKFDSGKPLEPLSASEEKYLRDTAPRVEAWERREEKKLRTASNLERWERSGFSRVSPAQHERARRALQQVMDSERHTQQNPERGKLSKQEVSDLEDTMARASVEMEQARQDRDPKALTQSWKRYLDAQAALERDQGTGPVQIPSKALQELSDFQRLIALQDMPPAAQIAALKRREATAFEAMQEAKRKENVGAYLEAALQHSNYGELISAIGSSQVPGTSNEEMRLGVDKDIEVFSRAREQLKAAAEVVKRINSHHGGHLDRDLDVNDTVYMGPKVGYGRVLKITRGKAGKPDRLSVRLDSDGTMTTVPLTDAIRVRGGHVDSDRSLVLKTVPQSAVQAAFFSPIAEMMDAHAQKRDDTIKTLFKEDIREVQAAAHERELNSIEDKLHRLAGPGAPRKETKEAVQDLTPEEAAKEAARQAQKDAEREAALERIRQEIPLHEDRSEIPFRGGPFTGRGQKSLARQLDEEIRADKPFEEKRASITALLDGVDEADRARVYQAALHALDIPESPRRTGVDGLRDSLLVNALTHAAAFSKSDREYKALRAVRKEGLQRLSRQIKRTGVTPEAPGRVVQRAAKTVEAPAPAAPSAAKLVQPWRANTLVGRQRLDILSAAYHEDGLDTGRLGALPRKVTSSVARDLASDKYMLNGEQLLERRGDKLHLTRTGRMLVEDLGGPDEDVVKALQATPAGAPAKKAARTVKATVAKAPVEKAEVESSRADVRSAIVQAAHTLQGRTDLPEPKGMSRHQYEAMRAGGWVSLADIRDALGERYNRQDVDAALTDLASKDRTVRIIPHALNREGMLQRDRDSVLLMGGEKLNWLKLQPAPRLAAKKAVKRATPKAPAPVEKAPEAPAEAPKPAKKAVVKRAATAAKSVTAPTPEAAPEPAKPAKAAVVKRTATKATKPEALPTEEPKARLERLSRIGGRMRQVSKATGGTADVTVFQPTDGGPLVVRKEVSRSPVKGVEQTPAEIRREVRALTLQERLSLNLGNEMGAPVPHAIQKGTDTLWMDFVPGVVPRKNGNNTTALDALMQNLDSPDARSLHLWNVLTGNIDVRPGNLRVEPEGKRIRGIDAGYTLSTTNKGFAFPDERDPFNNHFGTVVVPKDGVPELADKVTFTTKELTDARAALHRMRPEFEAADRKVWADLIDSRIDALMERAADATPAKAGKLIRVTTPGAARRKLFRDKLANGEPVKVVTRAAIHDLIPGEEHKAPDFNGDLATRQRALEEFASRRDLKVVRRFLEGGGGSRRVELLQAPDGSLAVRKKLGTRELRMHDLNGDGELLATEIHHAVGSPAPAMIRKDHGMDVILWSEYAPSDSHKEFPVTGVKAAESDDGISIGLADYLTTATDRHTGNWKPVSGRIVPLDSGPIDPEGWATADEKGLHSPFARYLGMGTRGAERGLKESIPELSKTRLREIRKRIEATRPSFERTGHLDWYDATLRRLDALVPRATGAEAPTPKRAPKPSTAELRRTAQKETVGRIFTQAVATRRPQTPDADLRQLDKILSTSAGREDIRNQMHEVLTQPGTVKNLDRLVASGVMDRIMPEVGNLRSLKDEIGRQHKDVYEHTLQVVRNAIALEEPGKPNLILRLAALLHDVGKPKTRAVRTLANGQEQVTFHRHDQAGADLVYTRLRRLGYGKDVYEPVKALVELHLRHFGSANEGEGAWTPSAVRSLANDAGENLPNLMKLFRADITSSREEVRAARKANLDKLEERLAVVKETDRIAAIHPDLTFKAISQILGVPEPEPGKRGDPRAQAAWNHLKQLKIDNGGNPLEDPEAAVKEWARNNPVEAPAPAKVPGRKVVRAAKPAVKAPEEKPTAAKPAAKPAAAKPAAAPATKPAAPTPRTITAPAFDAKDVVRRLDAADSPEAGSAILESYKRREPLEKLGVEAGLPPFTSKDTMPKMREAILRQTVTRRLEHAAYERRAQPAKLEAEPTPAPVKAAAKAVEPAGIKEDVALSPLITQTKGDNSLMHHQSPTMELARAYERAGRFGSANRLAELRWAATRPDAENGLTPQQVVDELKAIRKAETDPAFQRRIDEALELVDAPMTPLPAIPADTPPLARKFLEDLHAIPYARKVRGDRQAMGGIQGQSLVEQVAQYYRNIESGNTDIHRRPNDVISSIVRDQPHEANEAAYRLWDMDYRLLDLSARRGHTPLYQELRDWEIKHERPVPTVPSNIGIDDLSRAIREGLGDKVAVEHLAAKIDSPHMKNIVKNFDKGYYTNDEVADILEGEATKYGVALDANDHAMLARLRTPRARFPRGGEEKKPPRKVTPRTTPRTRQEQLDALKGALVEAAEAHAKETAPQTEKVREHLRSEAEKKVRREKVPRGLRKKVTTGFPLTDKWVETLQGRGYTVGRVTEGDDSELVAVDRTGRQVGFIRQANTNHPYWAGDKLSDPGRTPPVSNRPNTDNWFRTLRAQHYTVEPMDRENHRWEVTNKHGEFIGIIKSPTDDKPEWDPVDAGGTEDQHVLRLLARYDRNAPGKVVALRQEPLIKPGEGEGGTRRRVPGEEVERAQPRTHVPPIVEGGEGGGEERGKPRKKRKNEGGGRVRQERKGDERGRTNPGTLGRLLGVPSNGPDNFPGGGGLPRLPRFPKGAKPVGRKGRKPAAPKPPKKITVANLPSENALINEPSVPVASGEVPTSAVTGRLYPRPTSPLVPGLGTVLPKMSPQSRPTVRRAPETSPIPGGGATLAGQRVGQPLTPKLESLLDSLNYGDVPSMLGQLSKGATTADAINALARRTGVSDELANVRGREGRLRRLARALNQRFGTSTPIRGPGETVPGVAGLMPSDGATIPPALASTPEGKQLANLEGQLAQARRQAARLAGRSRSPVNAAAAGEAAEQVAALENQVDALRSRINPNPAVWNRAARLKALQDTGVPLAEAQRAVGITPEQSGIDGGLLPAAAVGRPVRVRRPTAIPPTEGQPQILELPPAGNAEPRMIEMIRRPPGAIEGTSSKPLSEDALNNMEPAGIMGAYRSGRARTGNAAHALRKKAAEQQAAAAHASEPDKALFKAEAARLNGMANAIESGAIAGGLDSMGAPGSGGGGGGLTFLSAESIRETLSKLTSEEEATTYLQSLQITSAGLQTLAEALGVQVDKAATDEQIIAAIAETVEE